MTNAVRFFSSHNIKFVSISFHPSRQGVQEFGMASLHTLYENEFECIFCMWESANVNISTRRRLGSVAIRADAISIKRDAFSAR